MKRILAVTLLLAACGGDKKNAGADSAASAAPSAATPAATPAPSGANTSAAPPPASSAAKIPPAADVAKTPGAVAISSPELSTVVGRLVSVGPDPVSWLAVASPGNEQTRIEGSLAGEMRGALGTYIWAEGNRSKTGFVPTAYEVRRVNEQLVDDGIVVVSGSTVSIRMRSGATREVPNAPTALKEMAGARIWVSKPVAGQAPSYGVIVPKK